MKFKLVTYNTTMYAADYYEIHKSLEHKIVSKGALQ